MNIPVTGSDLEDTPRLAMAPEMVAAECEALTRPNPVHRHEVCRRAEYGLIGDHLYLKARDIKLSVEARRAVLRLVAEMMVAQRDYDTQ